MTPQEYLQQSEKAFNVFLYSSLLLGSLRQKDETFVSKVSVYDGPDMYFENGIRNLDLIGYTYVEVKLHILYDTFDRICKTVERYKEKQDVSSLLIIYEDTKLSRDQIATLSHNLQEKLGLEKTLAMSTKQLADKCKQLQDEGLLQEFEDEQPEWTATRDDILSKAKFSIQNNNCTLFLGAGVSASAGVVGWTQLLEELLKNIHQKNNTAISEQDLQILKSKNFNSDIILARYIEQLYGSKDWRNDMAKILYKNIKPSDLVDNICSLIDRQDIQSVITYNYDEIIEDGLQKLNGRTPLPIYSKSRCPKGCVPVIHVHGFVKRPNGNSMVAPSPVLTEDEYHQLYKEAYHWSNVEQLHALDRNVCILIGLSMADPNLRRLLEISRTEQQEATNHYIFLERKPFDVNPNPSKDEEHYRITESIMYSLGLQVIWFKDKKELPDLIKKLL